MDYLKILPDDVKEIISDFAIKKLRLKASQTIQHRWFVFIRSSLSYELKGLVEECMLNNGTIVTFRNMFKIFNLAVKSDFDYIRKFDIISKIVFLYKHAIADSFLYNEDEKYREMINKYNILSTAFFYKYFKWLEDKNIVKSKKVQTEQCKQINHTPRKVIFYELICFFIAYYMFISFFY